MFGKHIAVVAAAALVFCITSDLRAGTSRDKTRREVKKTTTRTKYVPGAWAEKNCLPLQKGLEEIKKTGALGCVFFFNPKSRTACRAWEVPIFEKTAEDVGKIEGKVVFMRLNTDTRDGMPEDEKEARRWNKYGGSGKRGRTYVRLLYHDGKSCKAMYRPPRASSYFVRTLKLYVKKNDKRFAQMKKLEEMEKAKAEEAAKQKEEGAKDKKEAPAAEADGEKKKGREDLIE